MGGRVWQATRYPQLAEDVAEFMAATLFNTSRLNLTDEEFRAAAAAHSNPAMCAITEQVQSESVYVCVRERERERESCVGESSIPGLLGGNSGNCRSSTTPYSPLVLSTCR